jgi:small subunit ribosomal protein S27Ae
MVPVCAGVSSEMRLSVSGHQLEDEELLEELPEECTLAMNLELLGGGKKRKKKTYTKPKKIKKKHKKVKLAVLKYYRVDQASGKVTRLRKECPNEACGAGTFMAMHFNRHYCGKCTATYMLENPGKDPNADKNKKKEVVKEEAAAPAKGGSLTAFRTKSFPPCFCHEMPISSGSTPVLNFHAPALFSVAWS